MVISKQRVLAGMQWKIWHTVCVAGLGLVTWNEQLGYVRTGERWARLLCSYRLAVRFRRPTFIVDGTVYCVDAGMGHGGFRRKGAVDAFHARVDLSRIVRGERPLHFRGPAFAADVLAAEHGWSKQQNGQGTAQDDLRLVGSALKAAALHNPYLRLLPASERSAYSYSDPDLGW